MDERAKALHESLIVIDGHCDSARPASGVGHADEDIPPVDLASRSGLGQLDFPRLADGGVTAQFFALFVDTEHRPEAARETWRMLEAMEAAFGRSDRVVAARRARDVVDAKASGKLAAFLAIEGGESIGGSLDELRAFYGRGVRLMTLTWNRVNAIGRGAAHPGLDGLTPFGLRVIAEMERLGMLVDASHLCDQALDELLAVARRPVVASHSNSRTIAPHRRNLTDAQAERIAATGGLVGVTFAGSFIDADPARVTLDRLVDHIDHLAAVVGAEHVGLGSDFDGFSPEPGFFMPDCASLPSITEALAARGYPEADIRAIMGGNWLRVIGEVVG